MTAAYWQIGRRLVEVEQQGQERAEYGERLIERLSQDLSTRFGRGFGRRNLEQMRLFYRTWQIPQTVSAESYVPARALTPPGPFPLPWSHYVQLLSVNSEAARSFYETEALRGGWPGRQPARTRRLIEGRRAVDGEG